MRACVHVADAAVNIAGQKLLLSGRVVGFLLGERVTFVLTVSHSFSLMRTALQLQKQQRRECTIKIMVVLGLMVAFLSVCFSIASPSPTRARGSASTTCAATPKRSAMPGLTPSDGPGKFQFSVALRPQRP